MRKHKLFVDQYRCKQTWNITVSQVVKYREQIEEHKIENIKIIEIDKS